MPTRLSQLFVRTLREDPADAEVTSHRLLVRAGYIRRQAPGIFAWLPLGLRVRRKVERVIREEMDRAGAQEVHFPALLPREPYEATGRWEEYGDGIFRLKDRKGADYLLAPTHEEVFTLLVKDLYSSYKDLPLSIYQIQDKYRDEARPRAGLLRGREFSMKDAYSFDYTDAGLDASYQLQRDAYERIFTRLGLEYVIVQADAGAMGGSRSEEFLHPTPIGEDTFVRSEGGYAANVEAFTTVVPDAAPVDSRACRPRRCSTRPNTPTIQTLVDLANAKYPRPDRPRLDRGRHPQERRARASRTSTAPARSSSSALPGDREVDLKRAEVRSRRPRSSPPRESDFENNPLLVHGLHRSVVAARAGARRGVGHRHPVPARPPGHRRHRVDHRRQRGPEARLRPRRRPRLHGRRPRGGRGGARGRPRPRRLRARCTSPAAWRSATSSSSAASTRRRSACRCSTRTASSSP